jgi:genome maintenance exonuclease 1
MNFIHENIKKPPELEVEARENGRFYITPEGNAYPSVTTIISKGSDTSWIKAWHDRVGKAEAEKVLAQAGRRGTAVHEICEEYLKNNPDYIKGHMPGNIASFNHLKPFLDKHIDSVGGLELPLYSDKLKVAGRMDCLCKWDGEWAILDFKTSRREKKREDIGGYFMQSSCYALMIYELLGIFPGKIVIAMTIDDAPAKIFEERSADWIGKFVKLRNGVDI